MAIDADVASFDQAVLDRSTEHPVVVDFWAPWCGPCHQLAPHLEQAVSDTGGDVELVKVDIDRNPALAQRYGVQSIPAVKAFRDGAVVDEFVGAQPPAVVREFVAGLLPSEAEQLVEQGGEEALRRAIELEPARVDARLALARALLARAEQDEALALLRPVEHDREAAGLLARAELAADPATPSEVRDALAQLDGDLVAGALEALLAALAGAGPELRDAIRRVMIGVFGELGDDDDLATAYRRRLATALY